MTKFSEQEKIEWVNYRPKWFYWPRAAVCRFWHHDLPQFGTSPISLRSILTIIYNLLIFIVVAGFPVWRDFLTKGVTPNYTNGLITSGFVIALFLQWSINRSGIKKKQSIDRANEEQKLALNLGKVVSKIVDHANLKKNPAALAHQEESVSLVLKCIEHRIRLSLNKPQFGYFSVSLLTASSENQQLFISVKDRSNDRREKGARTLASNTLAYYVANQGRQIKIEHDFYKNRVFEIRGIYSSEKPPYRSILILPLPYKEKNGNRSCQGIVTIDCEKPFEFWSVDEDQIQILIWPFLHLLDLLLYENQGIEVDNDI